MLDAMSQQDDRVTRLKTYHASLVTYNPQWANQHMNGTCTNTCENVEVNGIPLAVSNGTCDNISGNEDSSVTSPVSSESFSSSIVIEFADHKGRQLVASKDIMPGEVVLKEPPLIMGPMEAGRATCLACLKPLEDCNSFCESCKAPLCSPRCDGTGHRPKECEVVTRTGLSGSENPGIIKHLHHLLTPLRTLLLMAEQKDLASLLESLEGNVKKREHLRHGWDNENKLASALKMIGVNVDQKLLKAICGIWDTNAFEIYVGPEHKYPAQALFPLVSMMNHSCVANVATNFRDGLMIIRAATPIKKGEPIALNYRHMLWGTRNRRRYLLLTKLFLCQCPRCMDPTELGSHASSIRCPKCKKGLYVPNVDRRKPWDCNNCPSSLPPRLADTLTGASEAKCAKVDSTNVRDIKENLVLYQEGLGPQHYLCVELRRLMVTALTTQPLQDMSSSDLWLVIDLTTDMLKLAKILEPGMSDFRGQMLLQQVRAATELIFRSYNSTKDDTKVGHDRVSEEEKGENGKSDSVESSLAEGIEVHNVNKLETQELIKQSEEFLSILQYDPHFPKAQETSVHLKKVIEESNLTEIHRA